MCGNVRGFEKRAPEGRRDEISEWGPTDNNLFLQTRLEKIQAIADSLRQAIQRKPDVKRRIWHMLDLEANILQSPQDIISLVPEMCLQGLHLIQNSFRLQHRDSSLLEGYVGPAIQVGSTRANGFDEFFRPDDPGDPPSGKAKALRQTVNEQDVVFVYIFDIICSGNGLAVAVTGIVVTTVEFVHDERRTVPADVLDLCEFGIADYLSGRVSWIGGQDDGGASGNLCGDLVGVDMIVVFVRQGRWDRRELRTYQGLSR